MLSSINATVGDEQTTLAQFDAIWQEIRQRLEAKKQRVVEEIGQYPHPIPACDAQFNGLLEDRATILQELGEVQGIFKQNLTAREQIALLNEFLQSARHLDGEVVEKIRQLMTK